MKINYDELLVQIMPFKFQPTFKHKEQWKISDYGCNEERIINQQVRKSSYQFAFGYGIDNLPIYNDLRDTKWRLIKYEDGKFIEHEDKKHSQKHVGTQIIIFPKSISPHSKGQLIIYNPKNKKQSIKVQAQQFTYVYVYIPLGYHHQITEINGTRIVATRMVFPDYKQIQYLKKLKELEQYRQSQIKQEKINTILFD